MAQPKRRTGESLESFNRRLVAYYKNRKAIEDAFTVEDAGDWDDLVKSKQSRKDRAVNRFKNNSRWYYEDRMKASKPPKGKNAWEGLNKSNKSDEEEVDIRDLTSGSPDSTPKKKSSRNAITPGDYTKNIGGKKFTTEDVEDFEPKATRKKGTGSSANVASRKQTTDDKNNRRKSLEEAFTVEDVDDFTPRKKSSRTVRTPGDYTKNIGNNRGTEDTWEVDTGSSRRPRKYAGSGKGIETKGPVAFSTNSSGVLTPGDYTKNIGGRKNAMTVEDVEDFTPRKRPSDNVKRNGGGRAAKTPGDYTKNIGNYKGSIDPVSRLPLTPGDYTKNIGNNRGTEDTWEVDTGPNRRPRKNVGPGKGIEKKGPVNTPETSRRDRDVSRVGSPNGSNQRSDSVTSRGRASSNNFDSSRVGYVTEDDTPKKPATNWITTRDGRIAKANSTPDTTKGEKRSARPATRSILEDGFRSKQKRANKKQAVYRGIRP